MYTQTKHTPKSQKKIQIVYVHNNVDKIQKQYTQKIHTNIQIEKNIKNIIHIIYKKKHKCIENLDKRSYENTFIDVGDEYIAHSHTNRRYSNKIFITHIKIFIYIYYLYIQNICKTYRNQLSNQIIYVNIKIPIYNTHKHNLLI